MSAALVLDNRVGACRLGLKTGAIEFSAGADRHLAALRLQPFVEMAVRRHTAGSSRAPVMWRHGSSGMTVELSRDVGDDGSRLHWRVRAVDVGFVLHVGVSGGSNTTTALGFTGEATHLGRARRASALKIAYCGAHSQSDLSRSEVRRVTRGTRVRSWWATALFDAANESGFVLGYLSAVRFAGRFDILGCTVATSNLLEQLRPASHTVIWSEPLWVAPARSVNRALLTYGRRVGNVCGRRGARNSIWGWGSWGHFGDSISKSTVLANAAALRLISDDRDAMPLVHVDHGWEERHRPHRPKESWRPRAEFGGDMRALGGWLRNAGCRLGIWVVPFAINTDAALPKALREVVVRDRFGEPCPVIGTTYYCVDPTSPAGEAWLRALFSRFKRWGVSYYKLDFLRALLAADPDDTLDGLEQPRRFHTGVTRLAAYRRGLAIIREVVGPRAHLLACGAPLLPSAGLIDSCRIGSDIEPKWTAGRTGIRFCAENVRCNFFWHRQVWDNDPDFLVLPRTDRLFRYWAAAVAFSGGPTLISANLPSVSASRRRELRRFVPALGGVPWPLGLDTGADIRRTCQTIAAHGETYHLVACFNRGARPARCHIDVAELGLPADAAGLVWDVLGSRLLGAAGRRWVVVVAAHDVRILCIRQLHRRPQLVGTSGHLSMGQKEIIAMRWHGRTATLRCTRGARCAWPDRLYLHVPRPYRLTGGPGLARRTRGEIAEIDLRRIAARSILCSFHHHP